MKISRLGSLTCDPLTPELFVSEPIGVAYFDGKLLTVTLDSLNEADAAEVETAVESFLALTSETRLEASPFVFQNYRRIAEVVSEAELGFRIESSEDVWAHVRPTEVVVSRRHHRDKAIYVQIIANCDWDQEHGLQIIYRRGHELSRVSDQDGHLTHADADGLPDAKDWIVGKDGRCKSGVVSIGTAVLAQPVHVVIKPGRVSLQGSLGINLLVSDPAR